MTTIPDSFDGDDSVDLMPQGGDVRIETLQRGRRNYHLVGRDAFLDAVRAELKVIVIDRADDVIVIPKADLPEVTESSDQPGVYYVHGASFTHRADVESLRRTALQHLAVCEHLDAHPPVDEAAVDALAEVLTAAEVEDTDIFERSHVTIARRLVAAGVRPPQDGEQS